MAKPILNYTTEIAASKTIGEIVSLLLEFGVSSISTDYDPATKQPTALAFSVETARGIREFALPAHVDAVQRILQKRWDDGDRRLGKRHTTTEHATRVAWRVLKDWVEAQLALIQMGMARVDEVMFPYLIAGPAGETAYQLYAAGQKQLPAGPLDR